MHTIEDRVLVIYHGRCADGFTAAWAARKFFGERAEYHPGYYQSPPPDVAGRDVVFLDFCYNADVMHELAKTARSIFVLDHHQSASDSLPHNPKTAPEELCVWRLDSAPEQFQGCVFDWKHVQTCVALDQIEIGGHVMIYAYFDMKRSGAGLAWDFFHPALPRPRLVECVEDRDLWLFRRSETRAVAAYLFSYEYDFDQWDTAARRVERELSAVIAEGDALIRAHDKNVAEIVATARRTIVIAGHEVPVVNIAHTMGSDAAGILARGRPFAAYYYDTETGREFGLRSHRENPDSVDVSKVAAQYGGGGHRNAAGFRVPRDHELAQC
jgi:oligoribonuclease NrnB/cAMP/cGMP phosphodiesterase (DHH superfamily)